MADKNTTPTFNMKVVVQETGLRPDTLRAWERRYGVPAPERTSGGHRLYSQRDIDILKWLVARQTEGMSISRAVDLWHQLEEAEEDPLTGSHGVHPPDAPAQPQPVSGEMLSSMRQTWLEACLDFDEYTAQHTLAQAFALFPLETVCFEILQRSLAHIGQGWYEGTVSVQQEHFASALALRQLEALLVSFPANQGKGQILVACPPKEQHTFSPLLLTLLLRRQNWNVIYLGADVPAERLAATVHNINPQLVLLTAQTLVTAATMLSVAVLLYEMEIPLAFGGRVFNQIEAVSNYLPGHFLGTSLRDTPQQVEGLVQARPSLLAYERPSSVYREALDQFQNHQAAIEARVHQTLHMESLSDSNLFNANDEMGKNITAALTLGDMNLLTPNIKWVHGLLMNYHFRMPTETISTYLTVYYEAVKTLLGESGRPINDWFDRLLNDPAVFGGEGAEEN